ncbi:elongation of fatty acids protein 3-like [Asparagus officinalis]|uniref:elongation of fatty acids protein 3-like n=1 Tax=Asparagus officinalis TaxID=4686 RepID=UPI00098E09E0|nr:elongation of fatty acids protein 3-like [Asparagus officinalis]
MATISYWLANHPSIINFRWSHAQSWGSTWSFLVASIALYNLLSLSLHLLLLLIKRDGAQGAGRRRYCFPVVVACQFGLMGCNLVGHLGFLALHFWKGGCNGMGAWLFNSVLNAALLTLFLNCHVRRAVERRKRTLPLDDDGDCGSHRCGRPAPQKIFQGKKEN